MTLHLIDTCLFDRKPKRTTDGYAAGVAKVSRSGIQIYSGKEVGKPNLERVRVYRPATEVFRKDALATLANRPMTNDHPREPVNSENWKQHAVGYTGHSVARDGEFVEVPFLMMDEATIQDIENGKNQLSVGYTCDLDWESGVTKDGEEYDAIQRNIRANHIAVVSRARGGDQLKFGDADTKICAKCKEEVPATATKCPHCGYAMTKDSTTKGDRSMRKFTVDGITVEMEDRDFEVVSKHIASLTSALKDASEETEEEKKKRLAAEEKMKGDAATFAAERKTAADEIAKLTQAAKDAALTPQKLDEAVKARATVVDKAKSILGDKLVIENKTDMEIRRQVVDAHMGDEAKGYEDVQVMAAFAAIKGQPVSSAMGDGYTELKYGLTPGQQTMADARASAIKDQNDYLTNAWKNGGQQKTA